MTDVLDKAIYLGLGIGEKVRGVVNELVETGEKSRGEGMGAVKDAENKIVDETVKLVGEVIKQANAAKDTAESAAADIIELLADRLKLATKDELDVVEKLALIAREKIESLEKRVKALEEKSN